MQPPRFAETRKGKQVMEGHLAMALAALAGTPAAHALAGTSLQPQSVIAMRLTGPISFDGRLDEPDWKAAPALGRFWEDYPKARTPAPEHTEARFLYDDRYLYVGLRMHLTKPLKLRKPFVRRDKVNSSHDYVQVYLDPQGSGQTSTLFRVNARGTQTDGVQDEAKGTESTDPDFRWEARSAISGDGWTAELRIPFTTLRVSRRGAQAWNVVVTRGVPRDQNTQMASAPWPSDGSCFLCLASKLAFPDLSPKTEKIILEPSLVTTMRRDRGSFGRGTHFDPEPSLDAQWLPFGGAVVDLTINPDFSQVEADSPQLTANQRFAIHLPEKRPFFREGTDLINTPLPILYTRTITAPSYGLRFTERSASLNGTIFAASDRGRGVIIEPGLLTSSLGTPDFGSKVGFAHLTDRIGSMLVGGLVAAKINNDGSYNELGGIDAAWQNSSDRLTAQLLGSRTRNPDRPDLLPLWTGQKLSGLAALAEWDHNGSVNSTLRFTRYDAGFRSWLGFVPRVGYEEYYAYVQKPIYPSSLSPLINRIAPYVSYDSLIALDQRGAEHDAALGVNLDATKASYLNVSWHPSRQVLTETGQERRFGQVQWTLQATPGTRIPVILFNGTLGRDVDYANGEVVPVVNISATLRLRPIDRLELEGRYTVLKLGNAPDGRTRLRETIPEFLATWFFGPAFYLFGDVQLHRSRRLFPTIEDDRSSLSSLQLVWEPRIDWRGYAGIRYGKLDALDPSGHGSSTEIYFKVSRRFGIR